MTTHDLDDTFTISQFQPESEPDSKVNSIRIYNNPSYQSNQMRSMWSENPIHSSEISKLSLLQVPSDSHALNIRCVDAAASESMEWLAGIGGLLTSAALAGEVRAGDCGELSTVASPAIDRRATAGAALNKAADDAVSAAAAAIAVAGHGECSRKFSRKP